jgi:hypothetical protein
MVDVLTDWATAYEAAHDALASRLSAAPMDRLIALLEGPGQDRPCVLRRQFEISVLSCCVRYQAHATRPGPTTPMLPCANRPSRYGPRPHLNA